MKEKPFYVSQLPEGVQNKLKDMQKKKLLDEGYSEKDAEYYANEFLNEKIYTAEEFYGNDFWEKPEFKEEPKSTDKLDHEIVNDKSLDAIKDNFTPPGAKNKKRKIRASDNPDWIWDNEDVANNNGKVEEDELDAFTKDLEDYLDKNPDAKKKNYY